MGPPYRYHLVSWIVVGAVSFFSHAGAWAADAVGRGRLGKAGICDMCATRVGPDAFVYTAEEFQAAVRAGLRAPDSVFGLTTGLGVSRQQLEDYWVRQVMADHTNWACCDSCAAEVEKKFAPAAVRDAEERRPTADREREIERLVAVIETAHVLQDQGHWDNAILHFERAIELCRALRGDDVLTAKLMTHLAAVHHTSGNYQEAKSHFQQGVAILEIVDQDGLVLAEALTGQGLACRRLGDYSQAEQSYVRARTIRQRELDADDPAVVEVLNNLAVLYTETRQDAEAEAIFRTCLKIAQDSKDRDAEARILNSLGTLYATMGLPGQAEPLLRESLRLKEALFGVDDPSVAITLDNLALVHQGREDWTEAASVLTRALMIRQAKLPPDHPSLSITLHSLARVHMELHNYEQASKLFERSVAIATPKLGNDHPQVASSLLNLAHTYMVRERYGEAEPLLLRSLRILESKLPKEHPDIISDLNYLAALYAITEKWDKAVEMTDRSRRILRQHFARVLPYLPESDQIAVVRRFQDSASSAFSLALARRDDPRMVQTSAAWVLNHKAVIHQALAERWRLAGGRSDDAMSRLTQELLQVRSQLATLAYRPAADGLEHRDLVTEITGRERELSKQLGLTATSDDEKESWVGLDQVRQALPVDAVLVEFAKVHLVDVTRARWSDTHYIAWVIPPANKGSVQLVDLGEAAAMEAAAANMLRIMKDAPQSIPRVGVSPSDEEFRRVSLAFRRKALEPLERYITQFDHWIISPDGDLWLVPWGALPLDDGRYMIEKHQISYVLSGRDLVSSDIEAAVNRPVMMADPDFDLGRLEAPAEAHRDSTNRNMPTRSPLRSQAISDIRWPRLPGTAEEVKSVAPKLASYGQGDPDLYIGKRALESIFKALHQPRVVVMSTHGFFLNDQDYTVAPLAPGSAERGVYIAAAREPVRRQAASRRDMVENPLLRCGLVLAGANQWKAFDTDVGDDGLLTGLEIVGTDLRGTELVVLSACDTGLGELQNGEGVAGLRQSFHLAGARTVVATLWKIPDAETADLMGDFFEALADGAGKAEALRRAQLTRIESLRTEHGAAHPLYWAAFTLSGDPGPNSGSDVFRTRSPREPQRAVASVPSAPRAKSWSPWPFVFCSVGLMLGVSGCWVLRRRFGKSRASGNREHLDVLPLPKPAGHPASVPCAPPVSRTVTAAVGGDGEIVRVTCDCGARLRIRKAWTGKRVKCPRCERVIVPSGVNGRPWESR